VGGVGRIEECDVVKPHRVVATLCRPYGVIGVSVRKRAVVDGALIELYYFRIGEEGRVEGAVGCVERDGQVAPNNERTPVIIIFFFPPPTVKRYCLNVKRNYYNT